MWMLLPPGSTLVPHQLDLIPTPICPDLPPPILMGSLPVHSLLAFALAAPLFRLLEKQMQWWTARYAGGPHSPLVYLADRIGTLVERRHTLSIRQQKWDLFPEFS